MNQKCLTYIGRVKTLGTVTFAGWLGLSYRTLLTPDVPEDKPPLLPLDLRSGWSGCS